MKASDLWRWNGTVGRAPYALVGVLGFALKHNLERWVAGALFDRPWSVFNYWTPTGHLLKLTALPDENPAFLLILLLLALPFIWVGMSMTVRRLRDLALPVWLSGVFFLPVVNLIFFLLLAVLPSHQTPPAANARGWLDRMIPESDLGSVALAILMTVPPGLLLVWFGASLLGSYGWGLFVGLPFCTGMAAALFHAHRQPRSPLSCVSTAISSVLLLGIGILVTAIEGAVCLLMAMPIAVGLAALGGWMGYILQRNRWEKKDLTSMLLVLLAASPALMGAERAQAPVPRVFCASTTVEVDAPPEEVWRHVIAFPPLPEPSELIFRVGLAYPMRAEMHGSGVGAERHCIFSTGAFVEPITAWETPRLLRFSVTENPEPMTEWSPWGHLDAPHLHGFLVSKQGQFLLTPLPGGRTRLEGTTWYQHGMWPASYWGIWSDAVIHRIHLRVLRHVKNLAEQTKRGPA